MTTVAPFSCGVKVVTSETLRSDRFGRKEPICIHVLTPRFPCNFATTESLNLLNELLQNYSGVQHN